jgi:hypothetical protein
VAPDTSDSTVYPSLSTSAPPSSSILTSAPGTSTAASPHANPTDGYLTWYRALEPYQRKIVTHGMLASLGFLVVLPFGALLARFARTFTPAWFRGHFLLNFYLGKRLLLFVQNDLLMAATAAALIFGAIYQAVRSVQASEAHSIHTNHKVRAEARCCSPSDHH